MIAAFLRNRGVPPTGPRSRRGGLTVALVGPDGAGKSTVAASLRTAALPVPVRTVYMGVNLESSTLMLPTTRLLLTIKKLRGRRPDLVADTAAAAGRRGWRRELKDDARMIVWTLEEWLRQVVASWHVARGRIVVFDRHFYVDYFHSHVAAPGGRRSLGARLHGRMLSEHYPRPHLVVCLDAPGETLFARKGEATPAWLERRRAEYLALRTVMPAFAVVDATRPVAEVVSDVAAVIMTHWRTTCR